MKTVEFIHRYNAHAPGDVLDLNDNEAMACLVLGVARLAQDEGPGTPLPIVTKSAPSQAPLPASTPTRGVLCEFSRDFMGVRAGTRKEVPEEDVAQLVKLRAAFPVNPSIQNDVAEAERQQAEAFERKKSFGDWLLGVARRDSTYLSKFYDTPFVGPTSTEDFDAGHGNLDPTIKAALAQSSGSTGGYLVPAQWANEILDAGDQLEPPVIEPAAQRFDMKSATLAVPSLDLSTPQGAGFSALLGGVTLAWTAENATRSPTVPNFKQIILKAWELSGTIDVSRPLLEDSGIFRPWLVTLFGRALAWFRDRAFLQGTGVGQPQGILGAGATLATGNNAGQTARESANSITFGDVAAMLSKLTPGSLSRATFICSPSALRQLLQLKDGANRAVTLLAGHGNANPLFYLAGRPLLVSEKLPPLGGKGDLLLVDRFFYVIGHRSLLVASSPDPRFTLNQVTFRVTWRGDGQPWTDRPITLQNGDLVSPFVVLN